MAEEEVKGFKDQVEYGAIMSKELARLKKAVFLNARAKRWAAEKSDLEELLSNEKEKSQGLKVKLELAEGEIGELKEQVEKLKGDIDYLTHKLSLENDKSEGNSNERNKTKGGNEGDVGVVMDEERHSKVFESEVEYQTFDEETQIVRNEPEVFGLLDRGDEDNGIEEEIHSQCSTLGELPGSLAPEMTESTTLKRKHVEHDPNSEAPMCKFPKLDSGTTKAHTHGEKCMSESKEVKMLKNSVGSLKPILNPCATRPHTRGWEKRRTSNTQSMEKQKKTSFSSWKTCCCCEMTESRTQKRKRMENISDAPSTSTSRSKVPKLKNASLHTT
ncbi:hypothetical protein AQUCO_04000062v1 [Aquilegia coerulea]|uniref:Uncharacterized protein n=1 Tax=Aquilegia coerulea TaxID=218851 RepID=A0A2G5CR11_AQUCA|nr:hypothetical protein AQUCO_04000062v1 [Aquilegia coerulea]